MGKVKLSGYIVVPKDDLDLVLSELPNHIDLTRQEVGCISFDVRQSHSEPCRFDVDEEFRSRKAFEHHQNRVKASNWGNVSSNAKRHYDITEE